MSFERVLVWREIQSATSKIWTQVTNFIFHDDDSYAKHTFVVCISPFLFTGTANRTVASTNMNATSSRAHTVVTIVFDQILKSEASDEKTRKSSVINLVDLAGNI